MAPGNRNSTYLTLSSFLFSKVYFKCIYLRNSKGRRADGQREIHFPNTCNSWDCANPNPGTGISQQVFQKVDKNSIIRALATASHNSCLWEAEARNSGRNQNWNMECGHLTYWASCLCLKLYAFNQHIIVHLDRIQCKVSIHVYSNGQDNWQIHYCKLLSILSVEIILYINLFF